MSHLTAQAVAPARPEPHGVALLAIVLILAAGNFLAVLDLTIANVLVPHIAGALASSPSEGTWVITGYGVAEAIMVPLTGWLTERFGPVRVFVLCVAGFGVFSALCGMATSLDMLIAFRVALGVCGGPLIPISQTLLLNIVPKRQANAALAVWSMTTILAPIAGPVIGGLIGDHWSWPWAFYIKAPLAAIIALGAWRILTPYETPTAKAAVDYAGLALLVVWVAALQTMLGVGQDKDWFNSQFIVTLLVVTLVGFAAFVIWETTDRKPIVDLSVFANRGFSVSMAVIAMAFGATFGSIVLVPLWLQTSMGYTATWAGYNSALGGVTMILAAPVTTVLMARVDHRAVACVGLLDQRRRVVDARRLQRPDDLLAVDVAAARVRRRHGHERHSVDGHVDQLAGGEGRRFRRRPVQFRPHAGERPFHRRDRRALEQPDQGQRRDFGWRIAAARPSRRRGGGRHGP